MRRVILAVALVQDEAEAVLLDTAAVVRGVRAGAQTMGESVADTAGGGGAEGPTPLEEGEDPGAGDEVGEAMTKEAPESG